MRFVLVFRFSCLGVLFFQSEDELKPSILLVVHCDVATVLQHGIFHYCQSQSCASHRAAAPGVDAVEPFKEVGQVFLGDALAISVIMGANIGTTLTAWIMSLGYNVDLTVVVFPAFFLGLLLIYNKRFRFAGDLLYGVAFVFFSLVLLSATGKSMDLEHNEQVISFFSSFDTSSYLTILIFLAIGTVITCIVCQRQQSGAHKRYRHHRCCRRLHGAGDERSHEHAREAVGGDGSQDVTQLWTCHALQRVAHHFHAENEQSQRS